MYTSIIDSADRMVLINMENVDYVGPYGEDRLQFFIGGKILLGKLTNYSTLPANAQMEALFDILTRNNMYLYGSSEVW